MKSSGCLWNEESPWTSLSNGAELLFTSPLGMVPLRPSGWCYPEELTSIWMVMARHYIGQRTAGAQQRWTTVKDLKIYGPSECRGCALVGTARSCARYQRRRTEDEELHKELKRLGFRNPRYG
jgi:hypothetical protein